jgi:cbb3-type cytochrome oxidase subunit 3
MLNIFIHELYMFIIFLTLESILFISNIVHAYETIGRHIFALEANYMVFRESHLPLVKENESQ